MNLFQHTPERNEVQDEPFDFAISFSDLMTGLVMLFLLVLMGVLYAAGKQLEQEQRATEEVRKRLDRVQSEVKGMLGVRATLVALLQRKFAGIDERVDVDSKTGAIRIGEAVLFDYESSALKPNGRQVVERVYRKLAGVLFHSGLDFSFEKNLASIAIEGHASREPLRYPNEARVRQDYLTNLELSQKRAHAVLNHLTTLRDADLEFLRRYAVAIGYGHSRLQKVGEPTSADNRRIEITFRLKDEEALELMQRLLREGPVK